MQESEEKPGFSFAGSTTGSGLSCQLWWSSIESCCPESASSKQSSLKMGVPLQQYHGVKLLDFALQDQDSCSTQSTGQSYSRSDSFGENNVSTQTPGFTQTGYNVTQGKHEDGEKFTSSMGTHSNILPLLQADDNQSFPQLAVAFPDQHFCTVMSAYGSQAMVMGIMPSSVPLPLQLPTSEPIYVNAKQYHGILRRRQYRAKLEAQNKIVKNRKPYLHESRHQHALKRVRGSGGRFLNTKKLQETKPVSITDGHNISGSVPLHLAGKMSESIGHQHENCREVTCTASCSNVTSASTSDDICRPLEFRFSGYSSFVGQAMQGGGRNYV